MPSAHPPDTLEHAANAAAMLVFVNSESNGGGRGGGVGGWGGSIFHRKNSNRQAWPVSAPSESKSSF